MRVVVQRIDTPLVAGAMMCGVPDAVDRRIAHVDIGTRQVNLESQYMRTIGKLAFLHPSKKIQAFGDGALAIAAWLARLSQGAAKTPHFVGRRAVDVGKPGLDQVPSKLVEPIEIVRRIVKMRPPVEAQPFDPLLD